MKRDKQKLLGYYNYTVIMTYIGLLSGFIGIIYAFENNVTRAVLCLMIAGFCDMFDGAIAATRSRTEREKCFGIQIDSLSDLVCFGVLPALIVYRMNHPRQLILVVCSMYLLCALIRLAYFNVDEQERQKTSEGAREIYYGLPVTMSALFLPIVYGAGSLLDWKKPLAMNLSLFAMSMLFVIPFPMKKPKLIGKICVVLCGVLELVLMALACDGV